MIQYVLEEKEEQVKERGPAMTQLAVVDTRMPAPAMVEFNGTDLMNQFINYIDRTQATARTYIINLRQFITWLKYEAVKRPTREDIISYRTWLSTEHYAIVIDLENAQGWTYRTDKTGHRQTVICKPNTVKQYLQSVRQFFTWTAAEGLYPNIAANIHGPKVKTDTHRKEALTAAEVLTIETSIDASAQRRQDEAQTAEKDRAGKIQRTEEQGLRLKAMYLLAVNAGLRTIEISRANVKDLQSRDGNTWLYIQGKGHSEADQRKPIAPEVKQALDDYLNSRTDEPTGASPLFVSTGNRSKGQRIAATTISTMLKRAMQDAGFDSERLTAHSLRHTAGTTVQDITGNLFLTQRYMRHANPATTEIYLHNETERQEADIAQQLYNRYHGTEETDAGAQLETVTAGMSPAQLEQLLMIARAIKTA